MRFGIPTPNAQILVLPNIIGSLNAAKTTACEWEKEVGLYGVGARGHLSTHPNPMRVRHCGVIPNAASVYEGIFRWGTILR